MSPNLAVGGALLALVMLAQHPATVPELPPLHELEPAVVEHLVAARRELEGATARLRGRELGDAYGAFAQVLHAYELFEPAEAAYIQATRLAPSDRRWKHLLGYLYQQTGRLDESAEQFLAARTLHRDDHVAAARLADLFLRLNRLRESRDLYQEIVEVFPAIAQNGLGEVALREQRFRDAVGHLAAVLQRVPQATGVHYSIAMAYRGLGQLAEAEAHLAKRGAGTVRIGDPVVDGLARLVQGHRGPMIQGQRALETGQLDEAVEAFSRAVAAAGPSDEQAVVSAAILLADRERFADAIALLERAHERLPAHRATATTLARLLASSPDRSLRDGVRALAIATSVYEAAPSPPHAETVALALAELNRCGEAEAWMQRALAAAAGDLQELSRLKGEIGNYQRSACRR